MDNVCNKLEVFAFSLSLLVTIVYELEPHTDHGFFSLSNAQEEKSAAVIVMHRKRETCCFTLL
jgi:hypothetical protein